MWKKKFPLYSSRNRDPVIGNPVLLETTMDEQVLYGYKNAAEVHLEQVSPEHSPVYRPEAYMDRQGIDRPEAYTDKQSIDKPRGLRKPVHSRMPLTSRNERPASEIPTVSSRYSQPSPEVRQQGFRRSVAPAASPSIYTDVSPPSSPEMNPGYNPHEWQGSPDISPVDEMPETPDPKLPAPTFRSHIPVPQRNIFSAHQAPYLRPINSLSDHYDSHDDRNSAATRWDDFIHSEATPRGSAVMQSDPSRNTSSIPRKSHVVSSDNQDARPSFAQRAMQGGKSGEIPQYRPGQIPGSSAQHIPRSTERYTNVETAATRPHPALKKVPGLEKITKRKESYEALSHSAVDSGATTPTNHPNIMTESYDFQPRLGIEVFSSQDIKPIVPLKVGNTTPPRVPSTPTTAINMPFTSESTITDQWYAAAASSSPFDPVGLDQVQRLEAFSILTGQKEGGYNKEVPRDEYAIPATSEEHLPSRFSFTTYATGTTHESRPSSPVESIPVPTIPSAQSSVISRKRPITSGKASGKVTARKPIPSQQLSPIVNDSEWRDSKELPQLPQELQSEDLIENLQVQVDNLHARRANLQRVIRDCTRSSSLSKAKLESMRTELADLQQKEHDTGLRLHRAYRRRDRQEYREPTAMWVRRVTG